MKAKRMSKTTDAAIENQNLERELAEVMEAWEEERAIGWIRKNPNKAFLLALASSPTYDPQVHGQVKH